MPSETWKAVANIIVLGWKQEGLFPMKIAPPFIQQCLFGDCGDLLNPYMQFVPTMDRTILQDALRDFQSVDAEDLPEVMDRHEGKCMVREDNIEYVIKQIAHKEMVQAPSFISECWSDVLKSTGIDNDVLAQVYSKLEPQTKAVLRVVQFPESMPKGEMEVKGHLNNFIRELDPEMLGLFMRFCTGSDTMVQERVTVNCVACETSENVRCPTAHTYGCVLKIHRTYSKDPYVVFKSDFMNIMRAKYWQMDIM